MILNWSNVSTNKFLDLSSGLIFEISDFELFNKLNREDKKMSDEFEPKSPDYSGEGVAIWKASDKHGKTFLKVKKARVETGD